MRKLKSQFVGADDDPQGQCPIILASSSPRRREILRNAGIRFRSMPSAVVEPRPRPRERRSAYAIRAALEKARSVMADVPPGTLILAADTIVCVDQKFSANRTPGGMHVGCCNCFRAGRTGS